MKTTTSFTSTISPKLIEWVDARAQTQKQTRRAVLEDAIRSYQRDAAQKILKEGFERVAHATDLLELAEWGMDDYRQIISHS